MAVWGRLILRAAWDTGDIEFVQINDPAGDAATLAYLLTFDSVHGRWAYDARSEKSELVINGRRVACTTNKVLPIRTGLAVIS